MDREKIITAILSGSVSDLMNAAGKTINFHQFYCSEACISMNEDEPEFDKEGQYFDKHGRKVSYADITRLEERIEAKKERTGMQDMIWVQLLTPGKLEEKIKSLSNKIGLQGLQLIS